MTLTISVVCAASLDSTGVYALGICDDEVCKQPKPL